MTLIVWLSGLMISLSPKLPSKYCASLPPRPLLLSAAINHRRKLPSWKWCVWRRLITTGEDPEKEWLVLCHRDWIRNQRHACASPSPRLREHCGRGDGKIVRARGGGRILCTIVCFSQNGSVTSTEELGGSPNSRNKIHKSEEVSEAKRIHKTPPQDYKYKTQLLGERSSYLWSCLQTM